MIIIGNRLVGWFYFGDCTTQLDGGDCIKLLYLVQIIATSQTTWALNFGSFLEGKWDPLLSGTSRLVKYYNLARLYSGSTIRSLLHGKINPKNRQVLSLGDVGFLQVFRVVSGDYGKS